MGQNDYPLEKKIDFIKNIYPAARECARQTGCSWELILAQAAQETGWGEKVLPGTNNIFNIKADAGWSGQQKSFDVWERVNGQTVTVSAPFRVYASTLESLTDRHAFLKENKRYTGAGLHKDGVRGDFKLEAEALQRGGYATDENYAVRLLEVFHGKTMQRALDEAGGSVHETAAPAKLGALPLTQNHVAAASSKLASEPAPSLPDEKTQTISYFVKEGDTLGAIAKAHKTTYEAIARLNNIPPPYLIHPKQRLMIPQTS